MRYYLVALFDDDSYKSIEPLQKSLSKKYKLYRNLPTLHITLEVIDNPNLDKLDEVLKKIFKPYKRFKVEFNDVIYFEEPHKSVNLKVENGGYIKRLSRLLNDTLKLHGFNVRENIQEWNPHVAVANGSFNNKDWKKNEYEVACSSTKNESYFNMAKIDRIELWKPVNNKKEMVVKSYLLKSF